MSRFDTRTLIEGALVIALAAVLNMIGFQAPFGGKISLGMLPIIVYALRRGPVAGLVAGALFGLVDYMIEPYFVHPVQFLLDYSVAFGLVGLVAGLFSGWWYRASEKSAAATAAPAVAATVAAVCARFVAHWVSGVVFFATVVGGGPLPKGTSAFSNLSAFGAAGIYSLLYNGAYLLPSAVLTGIAAALLMPALQRAVPVPGHPRPAEGQGDPA